MQKEAPEVGSRLPELLLIVVTAVWGATFLVIQVALRDAGPFMLLAHRFSLATAVIFLVFRRRIHGLRRADLVGGLLVGVATFASYAFQTVGLQFIPSSRSAFITALYVPTVPLLQLVIIGLAPRISAWIGILVSFLGLMVLSSTAAAGIQLGTGELLTLGCAFTAALQIVLIGRFAPTMDPLRLAFLQFAVVALLALAGAGIAGEAMPTYSRSFIGSIVALGVVGTSFGLGVMNWAQQTVSATSATVIYALEPVWAGIFGAAAGEILTGRTLTGSALIVAGVLVSEIRWNRRLRTSVE